MVVGGSTGGLPTYGSETRLTKAVRLDSPTGNECPSTGLYPYAVQLATSSVVNGSAVVCGGYSSIILGTCSMYDGTLGSWGPFPSLITAREGGAAVQLEGNRFWVTGGKVSASGEVVSHTEFYSPTQDIFVAGPQLPLPMTRHSLAALNHTHIVMSGGIFEIDNPVEVTNRVFLLKPDTEQVAELAGLNQARYGHVCGAVQHEQQGLEVVCAGGFGSDSEILDTVEILNLDSGVWRSGPGLLGGARAGMASVPFGDSFLLVGGLNAAEEALADILEYDGTAESWISRPESIGSGRSHMAAVLVDQDSMITCP